MNRRCVALVGAGLIIAVSMLFSFFGPRRHPELWFTADQQGDRLLRARQYAEAAKIYADPFRRGIALYRAGDFQSAVAAFSQTVTPEGAFNRANALVMLGKYAEAVKAYDRALQLHPDWPDADDNRAIAVVRRDRLKTEGGDETGGEVKPDEVVFEQGHKKAGDVIQVDEGPALNDEALRSLWLRRVQTKPADFLRAKFAYQLQPPSGGAP